MRFSLGTVLPGAGPNDDPAAQVDAQAPVTPAASASPTAPAGYWVNPANPTQWLPASQGAQVNDICFFGTGILPGRLRVAGNYANTTLYCGSFFSTPAIDSIVFYGGGASLAWLFLPDPYKWWVAVPLAALAVLGATMSVSI